MSPKNTKSSDHSVIAGLQFPVSIPPVPAAQSQDEILDKFGVARLLALTPEQVDERVRTRAGAGRIPHHVLGAKTIRFVKSEVLAWLMSQPPKPKREYRLSPAGRKSLQRRNRQRAEDNRDKTAVSL